MLERVPALCALNVSLRAPVMIPVRNHRVSDGRSLLRSSGRTSQLPWMSVDLVMMCKKHALNLHSSKEIDLSVDRRAVSQNPRHCTHLSFAMSRCSPNRMLTSTLPCFLNKQIAARQRAADTYTRLDRSKRNKRSRFKIWKSRRCACGVRDEAGILVDQWERSELKP